MTSTFVCVVSVKSKNFVPVRVLKHCIRKFSVSSTSRPEEGSALLGMPPGAVGGDIDLMGFNLAVMAWTLRMLERECDELSERPTRGMCRRGRGSRLC